MKRARFYYWLGFGLSGIIIAHGNVIDSSLELSKYVATPVYLVMCQGLSGEKSTSLQSIGSGEPVCLGGGHLVGYFVLSILTKLVKDRLDADVSDRELLAAAKKDNPKPQRILLVDLMQGQGGEVALTQKFFPKSRITVETPYNQDGFNGSLQRLAADKEKFDLIIVSTHGTGEFGNSSHRREVDTSSAGRHDLLNEKGMILWTGCQAMHECSLEGLKKSTAIFTQDAEVRVMGSEFVVKPETHEGTVPRALYYVATPAAYLLESAYSVLSAMTSSLPVRMGEKPVKTKTFSLKGCKGVL
ncbi:MAG: hypothetical protein R3A80_09345 [Bdellovibrionota bacterium]